MTGWKLTCRRCVAGTRKAFKPQRGANIAPKCRGCIVYRNASGVGYTHHALEVGGNAGGIDKLLIEDLSEDEDDAFAAALES